MGSFVSQSMMSIVVFVILAKGSVESTHKVPTSHYHTKHCHSSSHSHEVR